MLNHHIILKISGFLLIWYVGMTGLIGYALQSHGWAQDSAIPIKDPDVAAIYFAPVEANPSLRMDFAELEYQHPLTLAQRLSLTPEILKNLSQEHLDQLYARLTAGPIPDGPFEGIAFLSPLHREHLKLVEQVLEKLVSSPTNYSQYIQDHWMELWQGKVFDRRHKMLQNRVNWELAQKIAPRLGGRIEKAFHSLPQNTLLFPAKMYCGQSKLDSRRESIILDYAYSKDLPQYRKEIDILVGRNGLNIRDEIRMIHPGLYLGRVYLGKFFLINFLIMNYDRTEDWKRQVMKQESSTTQMDVKEDCWTEAPYRN